MDKGILYIIANNSGVHNRDEMCIAFCFLESALKFCDWVHVWIMYEEYGKIILAGELRSNNQYT